MPALTDSQRFKPSDFECDGLTPEQMMFYHVHLEAEYVDDFTLRIASKSGNGTTYNVGHDLSQPIDCQCVHFYHKAFCKSHWQRALLVLLRRKARLEREAQQITEHVASSDDANLHHHYFTITPTSL